MFVPRCATYIFEIFNLFEGTRSIPFSTTIV